MVSGSRNILAGATSLDVWVPVAESMMERVWDILHVTKITEKTRQDAKLGDQFPPTEMIVGYTKQLKSARTIEQQPAEAAEQIDEQEHDEEYLTFDWVQMCYDGLEEMHGQEVIPACSGKLVGKNAVSPFSILRFLKATSNLRNLFHTDETLQHITEARWPHLAAELEKTAQHTPSRQVLFKGRIRLETTTWMLKRWQWMQMLDSVKAGKIHISRAIGVDSSPQLGLELLSGNLESTYNGDIAEREIEHLPMFNMGCGFLDAVSKLMVILWYFFLKFGPGLESIQIALDQVFWFYSDFGTESKIVDLPNYLPTFLDYICKRPLRVPEESSFTFRNALFFPEWNHKWDNLLKALRVTNNAFYYMRATRGKRRPSSFIHMYMELEEQSLRQCLGEILESVWSFC